MLFRSHRERTTVASDICQMCIEDMVGRLCQPVAYIYTNNARWRFSFSEKRQHYVYAMPELTNAVALANIHLDCDETVIVGETRAVYNPGA